MIRRSHAMLALAGERPWSRARRAWIGQPLEAGEGLQVAPKTVRRLVQVASRRAESDLSGGGGASC